MGFVFDGAKEAFLAGNLDWDDPAQTYRCFMVDTAIWTPDQQTDEFFTDASGLKGDSGNATRADGIAITNRDASGGVADGDDVTVPGVTAGPALAGILIIHDDGVADASSRLVAFIDSGTGLPITPNGTAINIQWNAGADRIFRL